MVFQICVTILYSLCDLLQLVLSGHQFPHLSCKSTFFVVQLLSPIQLSATPWTAAHQASLSLTIFQSLLKPMSIESVMPSTLIKLFKMTHLIRVYYYLSMTQSFCFLNVQNMLVEKIVTQIEHHTNQNMITAVEVQIKYTVRAP